MFIYLFSACREKQNRCCERMSRLYVHELRSLDTCGMCSSHTLFCLDTMEVHEDSILPNPNGSAAPLEVSGFTMWNGGVGCTPSDPNVPGHCLKYLGGKGTGGTDSYTKGLKMMECSVMSRFCHLPISSYLQGTSDVELRRVRYPIFSFLMYPFF